ncbi:hypothetical protein GCM10025857_22030 [Alicyclobacillus contaminans]|nr:hypothetical protein GCM10025857_22030 [Alicyclobacillus contaminans]
MSGSVKEMFNIENIADRAKAYGIPGAVIDGNDIVQVMDTVETAVQRARDGHGPTLIEAKTYRWKGHSKSDARKYRTREEEQAWRARDPIARFRALLLEEGLLDVGTMDEIEREAAREIEDAVAYAESSPMPALESILDDVYA